MSRGSFARPRRRSTTALRPAALVVCRVALRILRLAGGPGGVGERRVGRAWAQAQLQAAFEPAHGLVGATGAQHDDAGVARQQPVVAGVLGRLSQQALEPDASLLGAPGVDQHAEDLQIAGAAAAAMTLGAVQFMKLANRSAQYRIATGEFPDLPALTAGGLED